MDGWKRQDDRAWPGRTHRSAALLVIVVLVAAAAWWLPWRTVRLFGPNRGLSVQGPRMCLGPAHSGDVHKRIGMYDGSDEEVIDAV
jgi:hypothetical protein